MPVVVLYFFRATVLFESGFFMRQAVLAVVQPVPAPAFAPVVELEPILIT